jgi:hypothetical protein
MTPKFSVAIPIHNKFPHLERSIYSVLNQSFADFEADLKNNKLGLDKAAALHNIDNFKRFREAYTKDDFQKNFFSLVNH